MPGYVAVDYSGGWNQMHDQMLINNINMIYQRYDYNFFGAAGGKRVLLRLSGSLPDDGGGSPYDLPRYLECDDGL